MNMRAVSISLAAVVVISGMLLAQEPAPAPPSASARETEAPGDAARGQATFAGKGECLSCHRVADRGSIIGPNLSGHRRAAHRRAITEVIAGSESRSPTGEPTLPDSYD